MDGVNLLSVTVDDTARSVGGTSQEVTLTITLTVMADTEFEAVAWLMSVLGESG